MVRLSNYIEDYYPAPTTTPPSQDSNCDGVPDSDNDGWCDTIDPCPDIPGIRCCGDGNCASDEDCLSCPEDCGECPNSPEPPPSTPPSDPCGDDLDGEGVGENCDECPGVKGKVEYNGCRCPGVPDDYRWDDCKYYEGSINFQEQKIDELEWVEGYEKDVLEKTEEYADTAGDCGRIDAFFGLISAHTGAGPLIFGIGAAGWFWVEDYIEGDAEDLEDLIDDIKDEIDVHKDKKDQFEEDSIRCGCP